MKYLKRFKESSKFDDLEERVRLYIVDLIDNGFDVRVDTSNEKTWISSEIRVISPMDDSYYEWNNIKDDLTILIKTLINDFNITQIDIVFFDNLVTSIDNINELEEIEDNYREGFEVKELVIYIIENK